MGNLITCLGECLYDMLPIVEHGHTVGFRMAVGGSPLNGALAAARLGAPVAFGGKVSTDFFGRQIRAFIEAEGMDTRFLLNDAAPTTLAFVAMEHGEPAYSFYGDGAADTRLTLPDVPEALFAETAILHLGSISLIRGQTPATLVAVAERIKGRALISYDPNIRAGLVQDQVAYRQTIDRLFGMVDLVKISAVDLDWLMPGVALEAAAAQILARGPALVLLTHGGEGALALRSNGARVSAPAFKVQVADTVGAGDTFDGATLAALYERGVTSRAALEGLPDSEIAAVLRFAAAAAAINVSRTGCNPPTRAEVAALLAG